jgi:hypothetical protein
MVRLEELYVMHAPEATLVPTKRIIRGRITRDAQYISTLSSNRDEEDFFMKSIVRDFDII